VLLFFCFFLIFERSRQIRQTSIGRWTFIATLSLPGVRGHFVKAPRGAHVKARPMVQAITELRQPKQVGDCSTTPNTVFCMNSGANQQYRPTRIVNDGKTRGLSHEFQLGFKQRAELFRTGDLSHRNGCVLRRGHSCGGLRLGLSGAGKYLGRHTPRMESNQPAPCG